MIRKKGSMPVFLDPRGTPEERTLAFISQGRELADQKGVDFSLCSWEVSRLLAPLIGRPGCDGQRFLSFTRWPGMGRSGPALPDWILDFAKAYCVHFLERTQITALTDRLDAFRYLVAAFEDPSVTGHMTTDAVGGAAPNAPSVTDLTLAVFGAAVEKLKSHYNVDATKNRAVQLELIAEFLSEAGIARADLGNWSHGCEGTEPPAGTSSSEFVENVKKRLPTPEFEEASAKAFARAVLPEDVLVTGCCALMRIVPSRSSQILRLEDDCLTEHLAHNGVRRVLIRLPGAKRCAPQAKFVPSKTTWLAELALKRMLTATEEPRAIKRWYDTKRNVLYLPPRLVHLRDKSLLTLQEASELIGITPNFFSTYVATQNLEVIRRNQCHTRIRFAEVERHILAELGRMERASGGDKYHPLLLLKWRALVSATGGSPCMYQPLRYETICDSLTPAPGRRGMFERLGIDATGTIRGNSHSSRHKLTTMAVLGHLPFEDMNLWFGRANPRWASIYDHSTNADFRDALAGVSDVFFGAGNSPLESEEKE